MYGSLFEKYDAQYSYVKEPNNLNYKIIYIYYHAIRAE